SGDHRDLPSFPTRRSSDLLSVLKEVGFLGIAYVVFRVIGKILGANIGAKIAKFPKVVQKYLGYTLIPQAGVAIGLSMVAQRILRSEEHTSELQSRENLVCR